jgi:N-methylhydantoinase A
VAVPLSHRSDRVLRISIDTGGTFTDIVYLVDRDIRVVKVFSTPANPAEAILSTLAEIGIQGRVEVRHGTTVATNTLLERTGARTAFVTTSGFEDSIAIGRQARPKLYDWFASPVPPLAPPELRFGITERTDRNGTILQYPEEPDLKQLAKDVRSSGAESVAVSLLFSFANPENERAVMNALSGLGIPVSASHKIIPEFREFERASTVLVNAYLAPRMGTYVRELSKSLGKKYRATRLQIMQSSGGIVSAEVAAREPVRTILSGPAGGVVGARYVARLSGHQRIISFDMGGTSTDVALVDRVCRTTNEAKIANLPVSIPVLDIHTVGAGGGSIARFDSAGVLHVGPESAGAMPGPICFGVGEQPTVTDANLVLGRLDPQFFLGGKLPLDEKRARAFMNGARQKIFSVEAFATGIVRLAEATMERAIRRISVERGHDPRDFTLVSFGGAGGLHACSLARGLYIPRVLVPRFPGALSAFGILLSDVVRDFSRTVMLPSGSPALERHLLELEQIGRREMRKEGLQPFSQRSLDLRYHGQGYELNIPASRNYSARFHLTHRERYGYADEKRAVEVVNARIRLIARTNAVPVLKKTLRKGTGRQAIVSRRRLVFGDSRCETPVYDRALLRAGDTFSGAAIITEYSATTVIPQGCRVRVDAWENIVVEVGRAIR